MLCLLRNVTHVGGDKVSIEHSTSGKWMDSFCTYLSCMLPLVLEQVHCVCYPGLSGIGHWSEAGGTLPLLLCLYLGHLYTPAVVPPVARKPKRKSGLGKYTVPREHGIESFQIYL